MTRDGFIIAYNEIYLKKVGEVEFDLTTRIDEAVFYADATRPKLTWK